MRYDPAILLHCSSAACLIEAMGIFAAAARQASLALPTAAFTLALLVEIWLQACSAVDRAVEFWICFVASRHFCLAKSTASPEPVVVGDAAVVVGEEVLELPHALSAIAPATSTTRSGMR